MNASDIVAILSGIGTMVTAIYIGVNTYRDKSVQTLRKKEEETNKLMIDDMMKSVEFNKKEVDSLINSIKDKEARIQTLEDHIHQIQDDCQARSLALIESLNIEKRQVQMERIKRAEAETKIVQMDREIVELRGEIEILKKSIKQ